MKFLSLVAGLLALPVVVFAQHGGHAPASPYAGQETRDIKSLSAEDIAELRRGGGWGLAKAAELNGMPGPTHVLELHEQIGLNTAQVAAIRAIQERMRAAAIREGERLIGLEAALEARFRTRAISEQDLRQSLTEIEQSRAALRYIHLSAHLATPSLLSVEQTRQYAARRGYGAAPCADVPVGHEPATWRRHNGCAAE